MPYSRLECVFRIGEAVYETAAALDRVIRRQRLPVPIRRGATLRPGIDTPLWRALAFAIKPLLRRRGAKAQLARELGLHRSRITAYFVQGSAMPDAERTLLLLEWYRRERQRESAARGRR